MDEKARDEGLESAEAAKAGSPAARGAGEPGSAAAIPAEAPSLEAGPAERSEAAAEAPIAEAEPVDEPLPAGTPAARGFELEAAVSFRTSGSHNDATAELHVSTDGMQAEAHLYPAAGEGQPLSLDYVKELMARLGIVSGILWDELTEAIMRCNLDRRVLRGVVVARGAPPVPELPEHSELEPRFRRTGPLVDDKAQRVDFRSVSSVFVVRAGEALARVVQKKEGVAGSDVRGTPVPFAREAPESFSPGANVARKEGSLVATVDGRLAISGARLDVEEVLLVKGGVDYHTGHIAFPGDVIIEGQVHDGFRVRSGGSIVCKSTLDAFEVEAKKDLSCPQGIIGRRRAQIRVGGSLSAKYVQNCRVAVRGDARIEAALVNSRLFCLGTVDLGDKGVVMGGETHALHGLRCGRLGNQARQRTIIRAGIDFTVEQRLAQANERLRLIAARSRQVEAAAAARPGPEAERARGEISKAAAAARELVTQLLAKLDADSGAVVEVKGDIFPGVVVEICRVSIVVDQSLKACKFRLDKGAGRVVVER